jgi:hypothetical protein
MEKENSLEKLKILLHVEEIVAYTLNLRADSLMGPKEKRVGVFGPYGPLEEPILLEVMRIIASFGYAPFYGKGFYKVNDPNTMHSIDPLNPPFIRFLFQIKFLPPTRYYHILPRVGSKAVHNLYPMRTNLIELEGCIEHKIPILGFVIREPIYMEDPLKNCDFLEYHNDYSECKAPNVAFCRFVRYCPFTTQPIVLPEIIREALIGDPNNRLIAVEKVEGLTNPLLEFLRN